jgi:AcrR family transcriptional regulator
MTTQAIENVVETLSTQDWIDAAKAVLLREGIDAVTINRIAKECGVTRGGFYWRFNARADLLEALLVDWQATNTAPLLAILSGNGSPVERFTAAASLWIEEQAFDPRFDTAIRNWAQASPHVAEVVRQIDEKRVKAFRELFKEAGYEEDEALVRARITYFHQIGYYALHIAESGEERLRLSKIYFRVLTGLDVS